MPLTLKKFIAHRRRQLGNGSSWLFLAILLPFTVQALFVGDPCSMKTSPGICKLASECPELEAAVKSGKFSSRDIVNCGFATTEEIICCPSEKRITTTESRSDDRFVFENALSSVTSTTTSTSDITSGTEATTPDFWVHLLTTTTTTTPEASLTGMESTTTAKPDFWLHLLTTTTTTTPAPLVVNGREIGPDADFIDLTALLSQNTNEKLVQDNTPAETNEEPHQFNAIDENPQEFVLPNRNDGWQNPTPFPPNTNWNMQGERNFFPNERPMETFQPHMIPNIPHGRQRHRHRQPMNMWANNQQFPNQQPMVNNQFAINRNVQNQGPSILEGNFPRGNSAPIQFTIQGPFTPTARRPEFDNGWTEDGLVPSQQPQGRQGGPSDMNSNQNFEFRPPLQWQDNNDLSQQNPRSESIWPANDFDRTGFQKSKTLKSPNEGVWGSSFVFPDQPVWTVVSDAVEVDKTNDPIAMVNEKLIKSGIDIVSAKLESVQRGNDRPRDSFESSTRKATTTTTTRSSKISDPFAPFQFRPHPDDDFEENKIDRRTTATPRVTNPRPKVSDPFAPFQFRPQTEENFEEKKFDNGRSRDSEQPVWSKNFSSRPDDDDSGSTKSNRSKTTVTPVTTRTTDRAAIIACREIDQELEPGLTPHILGGTPAEAGEFPHMAAIGYGRIGDDQGPYDYRCGGALIAKRFVLTAAHCVNSRDSQPAVVLLGVINIKDPEERKTAQEIPIMRVHIHPDYSSSSTYHDIALLELTRDAVYSEFVLPTCLYTDISGPPKNSVLYATGWGRINTGTRQKSDILLKAKLDIVPITQCNSSYIEMGLNRRIRDGVLETQLCAHDPGFTKDACEGDSGGPLHLVVDEALKKYRIVGVISAGFSCGSVTPGLYARVASYLDFIENIVWPHLM